MYSAQHPSQSRNAAHALEAGLPTKPVEVRKSNFAGDDIMRAIVYSRLRLAALLGTCTARAAERRAVSRDSSCLAFPLAMAYLWNARAGLALS